MNKKLHPIGLIINPSEIVVFKFILEAYDGLAELRTLNSQTGKLLILATEDTASVVIELVESLKEQLGLVIVPEEKTLEFVSNETEDWMTSEILKIFPAA